MLHYGCQKTKARTKISTNQDFYLFNKITISRPQTKGHKYPYNWSLLLLFFFPFFFVFFSSGLSLFSSSPSIFGTNSSFRHSKKIFNESINLNSDGCKQWLSETYVDLNLTYFVELPRYDWNIVKSGIKYSNPYFA